MRLQEEEYLLLPKPFEDHDFEGMPEKLEQPSSVINHLAKPGLSIIVPAYNEEEAIAHCADDLIQTFKGTNFDYEIIIVDDGSPDKTFDFAKDATKNGAGRIKLVRHSLNRGKGHAVMTGISLATNGIIAIQDADLEYPSKNIPMLVEPILRGKADVVYGSRFLGHMDRMSLSHHFGNRVLTFVTNILYGCKLTDVMTGAKVFKKDVFNQVEINSGSFEFEVEVTAKILEQKFKIIELPTSYMRRTLGKAKIKWTDGLKCSIWLILHKFASKARQITKIF
jgi:glycosyltransferase involved in cell wall biosynthesis